ncbi:MAG: hypothetical protein ACNA8W_01800 [Bradymonadaceae bacterium]
MSHQASIATKSPRQKDEAWHRAARRYSILIIVFGLLGGTCLGFLIAGAEADIAAKVDGQVQEREAP